MIESNRCIYEIFHICIKYIACIQGYKKFNLLYRGIWYRIILYKKECKDLSRIESISSLANREIYFGRSGDT